MAGIYLHIPFCKTRCIYCDFYSTTRNDLRQRYVRALCRELVLRRDYLRGATVETVYFGGGTPSQLTEKDFESIFQTLQDVYGLEHAREITLEANPDDLTDDYVQLLRHFPFNRISMGIQTFDEQTLQLLQRRHTATQAIEAVQRCRQAGFNNLSIDLIYGLPGETEEKWKHDLQEAVSLHPEHISAYHLTYEEGTPLYRLREMHRVKKTACAFSPCWYKHCEKPDMYITKYPISACPATTHSTTRPIGKAYPTWDVAPRHIRSTPTAANGTKLH